MPTYNRAYCIRTAIDSLLHQTYRRFELVIADDGSTDETEEMIQAKYGEEMSSGRIVYLKLAHRGVCHARNAALRRAVAEWIAYLDTDNVVSEDFLATFADGIRSNPQARNFYAALVNRQSRRVLDRTFNRRTLTRGNFIDMGVYCHHRSLIAEFGGFDQEVAGLEDWDLILRHTAKYTPVRLGKIVLNYQDGYNSDRLSDKLKLGKAHDIIHARYWNGAQATEEDVRLVSQSHFFDAEWYRATYGDRLNGMAPAEHYLSVGWLDNMAPGPFFDGVAYMGRNPDIASALVNPLLHYERYGRKEGRTGFLRTKVEAIRSG
jgi:glycosyltransferase involved in cell wall biosynthesis